MSRIRRSLAPLLAAHAANPDLLVTKTADTADGHCDSDCSLREAIQLANATPGPTRILLPPDNYHLSIPPERNEFGNIIDENGSANGDLDIRGNLTIVGGANIIADRMDRVMDVLPGASVEINGPSLINGQQPFGGGGLLIEHDATVTFRHGSIADNLAGGLDDAVGFGGGIVNYGTLTIESAIIAFNKVERGSGSGPPSYGGAIYNVGKLVVRETQFIGNHANDRNDGGFGGAIYNESDALILRSLFRGNGVSRNGSGTAILNGRGATLRMVNSTVTEGDVEGSLPLGAVTNGDASGARRPVMRLVNVTIAKNASHGLLNYGFLSISNSIIAGNRNPLDPAPPERNCLNASPDAVFTQKGLLLSTDLFTNCEADIVVANADVFTKVLYPLGGNNWPIDSFAIRRHSPAADAGVGQCPSTDQRRVTRPRDGDGDGVAICDLGAYERPKP